MSNPAEASALSSLTSPGLHRFELQRGARTIPASLWTPSGRLKGIVMACHGGSGHKESPAILAISEQLIPLGYAVVALDGPVHGARREDGNRDSSVAKAAFREAWRAGVDRFEIANDYIFTLDALVKLEKFSPVPVGYIGVSMGTAYGIPLLANESRIKAAAIGLWSTSYPASEHLVELAPQLQCAIWFTQQWDDEAFNRADTQALYDAIGSSDKRLVAYPGPHMELQGERLQDAVIFLERKLQG